MAVVPDSLLNDSKVASVSSDALRLWLRGWLYCSANLTDGLISKAELTNALGAKRARVAELVQAGLWHELQTGSIVVNDYLEHNPTRADAERQRGKTREKVRRHRERQCNRLQTRLPDGVTDPVTEPVTAEFPPQTPPSLSGSSDSSVIPGVLPSYQPSSETEQVARATQKPSRKRREIELPEGWKPNEKHAAKAIEKRLDVRLEAERFRERALAKGLRYVDWDRAFNTWLLSPFAQPSVNGKPPGALDHEARRIEANTRYEHRAWLLEQASSGAFGAKAQAAAEAGQIDRLEAWYEQQRGRRAAAAGASGSGGPAQIGGLLQAALGGREASNAR